VKNCLRITLLAVVALLNFGCATNYYSIPREDYQKKVRVLGVAPFFLDTESDIKFPDKAPLLALVRDMNRTNEPELVARLKDSGAYLSVRMPDAQADRLFTTLMFRRELRGDAGIVYNKYFFKQQELKDFIEKNNLDAVMLVVVSGLTRSDKVYSSNLLEYLQHDYNYLILTAQILDANGTVLWEYPNFRQHLNQVTPLINLQFPDFDEATANVSEVVDVKFKTIPGITRTFGKTVSSSVQNNARVSKPYDAVFDEIVSMLKPPFRFFWEPKPVEPSRPQRQETLTAPAAATPPASAPAPAVTAPPAAASAPAAAPAAEPAISVPGEIKTETLSPASK
jgi:hypothetical protein